MPLYEYKGQQYDIATTDPAIAKQKILSHLGIQDTAAQKAAVPTPALDKEIPTAKYSTKEVIPGETPGLSVSEALAATPRNMWEAAKGLVAESFAGVNFAASVIPFVGGVVSQGVIEPTKQVATTGKVDWSKARKDAHRIISPLEAPSRSIQSLADAIGLGDEYNNALINQGLTKVSEGLEWVATETEKKTGLPKDGNLAVLETLMLTGVPGARPLSRVSKDVLSKEVNNFVVGSKMLAESVESKTAPIVSTITTPVKETVSKVKSSFKKQTPLQEVVENLAKDDLREELTGTINIPDLPVGVEELPDFLFKINNEWKADQSLVVNLDKLYNDLDVSPELRAKLRRYVEETAEGNEFISTNIDLIKKEIQGLYEVNRSLFEEADLRSSINPEGKTSWKDFAYKEEIKANKEKIAELNKKIDEQIAGYKTKETLDPTEFDLFEKTIGPVLKESANLTAYLQSEGVLPTISLSKDTAGAFFPRLGAPTRKGALASIAELLTKETTGVGKMDPNRGPLPSAALEQKVFVHELPNGVRKVITFKGNDVVQWNNRTSKKYMGKPKEDIAAGDKLGTGTVKVATLDEVKAHTPFNYVDNSTLVAGYKLAELRSLAREHMAIKAFMETPFFKANALEVKPGAAVQYNAPMYEGFRDLASYDRYPQLRNYKFKDRVADMLDDAARQRDQGLMRSINDFTIKNLMLVPFVHMHNELFHWYIERGLTGLTTPQGLKSLATTAPQAFMEVVNQGPLYREIAREGGNLLSLNAINSPYLEAAFKKATTEMKSDPGFISIAKELGIAPAKLYNEVSKLSNQAMWTTRDILYTQIIMEKLKSGETMKEAIKSTEEHMPNYRLPSTILENPTNLRIRMGNVTIPFTKKALRMPTINRGGSGIPLGLGYSGGRGVSKALQSPYVVFGPYKHGMLSSGLNTLKDIVSKEKGWKKNAKGVNSALALAAALYAYGILWGEGLFNQAAQELTGDSTAEVRAPGFAHVVSSVKDVWGEDPKKDAISLLSTLITPSPGLAIPLQAGLGFELYNRRDIYSPADPASTQIEDLALYLGRSLSPQVGNILRATDEDYGGGLGQYGLRLFDIKTKTQEQLDREERDIERRKTAAENKEFDM